MSTESKHLLWLHHSKAAGTICAAVLILFSSMVSAQTASVTPVSLPGTESHVLKTGLIPQALRIYVSLPFDYASSGEHYPVIYVTDGDSLFPRLYATLRTLDAPARNVAGKTEVPTAILVGITYDDDLHDPTSKSSLSWRIRDFTPPMDASYIDAYVEHRARNGTPMIDGAVPGGADKFLSIIEDEIKPYINSRYRVDTSDETYVGYSQGGLFGLYVLFQHTAAFDRYVIGSPSLWWGNEVGFDLEAGYASTHDNLNKSVFISVGADEKNTEPAKMISNVQEMARRLEARAYPSLQLTSTVIDGENHLSGISAALSKGIRAVFQQQSPYDKGRK